MGRPIGFIRLSTHVVRVTDIHSRLMVFNFTASTDLQPETIQRGILKRINPFDLVRGHWRTAAAVRSFRQPRQGLGQSPPRSIADSTMKRPISNMQRESPVDGSSCTGYRRLRGQRRGARLKAPKSNSPFLGNATSASAAKPRFNLLLKKFCFYLGR